jgi:hypothetical protein
MICNYRIIINIPPLSSMKDTHLIIPPIGTSPNLHTPSQTVRPTQKVPPQLTKRIFLPTLNPSSASIAHSTTTNIRHPIIQTNHKKSLINNFQTPSIIPISIQFRAHLTPDFSVLGCEETD